MKPQENLKSKIFKIKQVADYTKSFIIQKPKNFNYIAGQHIFLEISKDNGKPFSLVSCPNENFLEFATIIRDNSSFKNKLDKKKIGDELIVSGPYGKFYLEDEEEAVFIAGGIGITPFMGIIRDVIQNEKDIKLTLLYSNKSEGRAAFKEELDLMNERSPNLNLIYTMTEQEDFDGEHGRINKEFIESHVSNPEEKSWFISGSPGFVQSISLMLKKEFKIEKIKLDSFGGY